MPQDQHSNGSFPLSKEKVIGKVRQTRPPQSFGHEMERGGTRFNRRHHRFNFFEKTIRQSRSARHFVIGQHLPDQAVKDQRHASAPTRERGRALVRSRRSRDLRTSPWHFPEPKPQKPLHLHRLPPRAARTTNEPPAPHVRNPSKTLPLVPIAAAASWPATHTKLRQIASPHCEANRRRSSGLKPQNAPRS